MTSDVAPPRRLRFDLPGEMSDIMARVHAIRALLHEAGCSASSAQQFAVVTEEILTNIRREAWPGRDPGHCSVEVAIVPSADAVDVSLRTEDDGIAFDPTAVAAPDLELSLDDREVGGLGILLVRSMTDTQAYRREGGRNVFQVGKRCPLGC